MASVKGRGFPGDSAVRNSPAVREPQEIGVPSLSQEDPPEEGMATYSSILAWRTPWTEEAGGVTKSQTPLSDFTFTFTLPFSQMEL